MPTSSETLIVEMRAQARVAALRAGEWWFDPVFPANEPIDSVTLASGLVLPSPIVVQVSIPARPRVDVRLEVADDSVTATQITITRTDEVGELAASALRNLPFKKIINDSIERVTELAGLLQSAFAGQHQEGGYRYVTLDASGRVVLRPDVVRTRSRRLVDDALLRAVAEVVRANPTAPNDAVHKQMHTSTRNASRWIAAAKERGFLNDSEEENG